MPVKKGKLLAVLGLGENQYGADLRDRFGEDCRRQDRRSPPPVGEVALVQGYVLDTDDALVELELGDAIDQQKGIAVREYAFDRRVVERKRQVRNHSGEYSAGRRPSRGAHAGMWPQRSVVLNDTGCGDASACL